MATKKSVTNKNGKRRHSDRDERMYLDLAGIRAAVQVATSTLTQRGGIDRDLGTVLHRAAIQPLNGLLLELEPTAHG